MVVWVVELKKGCVFLIVGLWEVEVLVLLFFIFFGVLGGGDGFDEIGFV